MKNWISQEAVGGPKLIQMFLKTSLLSFFITGNSVLCVLSMVQLGLAWMGLQFD